MEFSFYGLKFEEKDGFIKLAGYGDALMLDTKEQRDTARLIEVQIAGEHQNSHQGIKAYNTSESLTAKYVSHTVDGDKLTILLRTEKVEINVVYKAYSDTNAISTYTEVKNISKEDIVLEQVSSLVMSGLAGGIINSSDAYFYRFTQSHHGECQVRRNSFFEYGFFDNNPISQKRIHGENIGSWSTKEELPQGIIEYKDKFLMFQIESNNTWQYEISDMGKSFYMYLSGADYKCGGWAKKLSHGETYTSPTVAVAYSNSLNGVLKEMTVYRRHIAGTFEADENLPTIFNEYMHLSWNSPDEKNTKKCADGAKNFGVKYYVIDCGWHDEEDGAVVFDYVGKWFESKRRYPSGLKKTMDYIKSLGLKPGLWIEPEVVGYKCQEMIDYYGDDCFYKRHGKKVLVMGRYFLDFRKQKVIDYMTETIRRMVEDYGAEYIKMDYNQDVGVGYGDGFYSAGEGLEICSKAYLKWIKSIKEKFPDVLFETCSSGGMRMDYETLKYFSIISTSDQTRYKKYPYIAGNILSAVLPEQAAVWSYPVDSLNDPDVEFHPTAQWVNENVSREQVIMNMINSLLGRMHLASHIELLTDDKKQLIKEGVEYFKKTVNAKRQGTPYLPLGFTDFSCKHVVSGFKTEDTVYLAVWNLGGKHTLDIPVKEDFYSVKIAYPENEIIKIKKGKHNLKVKFTSDYQARFLEIGLKNDR